jgi:SsrA-binding protein
MMETEHIKIVAKNRKAFHNYAILEKFEAGISLKGTEVKSIRDGKVTLGEAYARPQRGNIMLINMHVNPWDTANKFDQHDPTRPRQLLLHRREIQKIIKKIEVSGHTLVPLMLYFKQGRLKIQLALAKGKDLHDKRNTSIEKDAKRDMDRARKNNFE